MERMWAPWRREYIESDPPDRCIFCVKIGARDDAENHIIKRGETCFCMLNRYPYNVGHVMIAPHRHVASLRDLTSAEVTELFTMVGVVVELLREKIKADGFNVGINLGRIAGAGVEDHIHVHVVPRWNGDTNFMPVTADTKVLPQSLDDMYRLLTSQ
jgi:ATP adenylyltransferase